MSLSSMFKYGEAKAWKAAVEELKRQYNRGQLSKEYYEKKKKELLKR